MIYDWFKIFNQAEFEATGLVSRMYSRILENYGAYDILATHGDRISVLFDGVFLTVELNATNPFSFEGRAVYLDPDGFVWVGIEVL